MTAVDYLESSAVLDATGDYRFSLVRSWCDGGERLLWIMLNPSTADGTLDDPTIRKCVGFSWRLGYGSLEVVNLYALRATDPKDLWTAPGARRCHADNDRWIHDAVARAGAVVAAWGAHSREPEREDRVVRIACPLPTWCLGYTKDGKPRHPLMVAYQTGLVRFVAHDDGATVTAEGWIRLDETPDLMCPKCHKRSAPGGMKHRPDCDWKPRIR